LFHSIINKLAARDRENAKQIYCQVEPNHYQLLTTDYLPWAQKNPRCAKESAMQAKGAASIDTGGMTPWRIEFQQLVNESSLLDIRLNELAEALFAPGNRKILRKFSSTETANLLNISDTYLREITAAGLVADIEVTPTGRRFYSLERINQIRLALDAKLPAAKYVPRRRDGEMCQILACVNYKGGSGKTTQSVHLAQYLALQGYRVLAVDLDPQGSMTSLLGYEPERMQPEETLYGAVRYEGDPRPLAEIAVPTYFTGIDLVPAGTFLMEIEYEVARVIGDRHFEKFFNRLPRVLKDVGANYDVIVLDTAPNLGFATLGSMCAATGLILTIHPHMLDTLSARQYLAMFTQTMQTLIDAGATMNLAFVRYLFTRREINDSAQSKIVTLLRSLFEDRILQSEVLKSVAIAEAQLARQTLYDAPKNTLRKSTAERALESMNSVNAEIAALMRQAWGRT
jgi:chromosome partitioning protein